jgi:hypothetical protein
MGDSSPENRAFDYVLWKNTVEPDRSHLTVWYGACALHAGKLRLQTHTYCCYTVRMITRTRCNITLMLHVMLTRQYGILSSRFIKHQTLHHCHSCLPHRVNTCPESRVCLVPLVDLLACFATLSTYQNT